MWWDEHIIGRLLVLCIVSTILASGHIPFIMNQATGRSKFSVGRIWPAGQTLHAWIKVIFHMSVFCACLSSFYKYHVLVKKHLLAPNDPKIFCESDPLHFSFKTCVDQQFARKKSTTVRKLFHELNFFHRRTFKNWGKLEVQLHRTSYLMSPSRYMYNLFGFSRQKPQIFLASGRIYLFPFIVIIFPLKCIKKWRLFMRKPFYIVKKASQAFWPLWLMAIFRRYK